MQPNNITIKYFVYCRKSSEDNKERQMQSIESQERELTRTIQEQGLVVAKTFKEEKSAHTRGRPIFNDMLTRLENGEANAILTYHGNRLARNAFDGGWIITAMDEGKIREIKTPHRTYYNTPDDKFFLQLEFGISKKDSDDKSVVVKRGLKAKCEKGWMPGVAPMGYLNTPQLVGGSRYILKDEDRFDLIKKAWEMMASGSHQVSEIQRIMNEDWKFKTRTFKRQGGVKMNLSHLYKMFNDTFYYGYFEYPRRSGQLWKGAHEPMVSEETFNQVQLRLGNRTKYQTKKKLWAYTGIMRCGNCDCQITASEKWKHQKNGNVHHYLLYHCTRRKGSCHEPSIQEGPLEEQIKLVLDQISIAPEFFDFALDYLRKQNVKESENRNAIWGVQERAYTLCLKKLDGIIDMRAAKEISEEEYNAKKVELIKEKERLEGILNGVGKRADEWLQVADDVLTFARDAKQKFESTTDPKAKHRILSLLGSNFILKDRKLTLDMEKVIFAVQTVAEIVKTTGGGFEPPNKQANKRKTDVLASASPTLLRG